MERRDILKDEIEALGRALGKLLAQLFGTEDGNKPGMETVSKVAEAFTELNIDMDTLLTIPANELKPYLKERNFQPANLENLSEIILETGKLVEKEDLIKARLYFSRTLELYKLMDEVYGSISLERYQKEAWIQARLKD